MEEKARDWLEGEGWERGGCGRTLGEHNKQMSASEVRGAGKFYMGPRVLTGRLWGREKEGTL